MATLLDPNVDLIEKDEKAPGALWLESHLSLEHPRHSTRLAQAHHRTTGVVWRAKNDGSDLPPLASVHRKGRGEDLGFNRGAALAGLDRCKRTVEVGCFQLIQWVGR